MARFKNFDWSINDESKTGGYSFDTIKVSLLMDIRDELQKLNTLLHCGNFTGIPRVLARISRNTAKPRKKVRK